VALTVGELVAYAQVDKSDFQRGTKSIGADLRALQATTTSSMQSMESTVTRSLDDIERAFDDLVRYGDLDLDIDADTAQAFAALKALEREAEKSGQRAGDGFMRGADGKLRGGRGRLSAADLFEGLVDGASQAGSTAGSSFLSTLGTAARTGAGPALIGALGGAAVVAGPAIGAAAGGAIVAGIGVKLTALGVQSLFHVQEIDKSWSAIEKKRVAAANKQAEELKSQFAALGRDITLAMQEASDPLRSVLDEVEEQARSVADDVAPNLKKGFEDARVPMEAFVRDLGDGLKDIGDAIPSLMDGFGDVLGEIDIDGLLADIGTALDDLGTAVSENRAVIGTVLNGLLDAIPMAIDALTGVINFFGDLGLAAVESAATITEHMAGAVGVITDLGTGILQVVRNIGTALSDVPGMEEIGAKIVEGADAGIAKLGEFKTEAAEASRAVRLTADIAGFQAKIDEAITALDDPNLSKERRAELNANVDKLIAAKGQALLELGDPALVKEYKSEINANIDNLRSRLADARKELRDPELTKERKAELRAEIGQLQTGVKRGKDALDSVKGKTVKVDGDTSKAVSELKKVTKGLDGLQGDAQAAGKGLGSGLVSGIQSMIGSAVAAARSLAQSALDGAKNLLGIHSPSTVMAEVGRWTAKGLIQGLQAEEGAVKSTVERMVAQVKEAFKSQPDVAEGLLVFIRQGNKNLEDLALQREALVQRLADAKELAKKVAGDAAEWAAITGLDASAFTGAGDMAAELQKKASAINSFANNINALAKRGLNKASIQQIIDAGVEKGATFAEMLVGSDGSEIKALNKAQKAVDKASKKLGKSSADAMFDVGKKSGEGYLKGLQASLKALDKEMAKIVKALVAAIKKELKIKSPSQVFAEIGVNTMQGYVEGVSSMAGSVVEAARGVIGKAVSASKGAASIPGSMPSLVGSGAVGSGGGQGGEGFSAKYGFAVGRGFGAMAEPTPAAGQGVNVNIDMSNSVVREEPDLDKIGNKIGFRILSAGLA
jgi:hypothetical protein